MQCEKGTVFTVKVSMTAVKETEETAELMATVLRLMLGGYWPGMAKVKVATLPYWFLGWTDKL